MFSTMARLKNLPNKEPNTSRASTVGATQGQPTSLIRLELNSESTTIPKSILSPTDPMADSICLVGLWRRLFLKNGYSHFGASGVDEADSASSLYASAGMSDPPPPLRASMFVFDSFPFLPIFIFRFSFGMLERPRRISFGAVRSWCNK